MHMHAHHAPVHAACMLFYNTIIYNICVCVCVCVYHHRWIASIYCIQVEWSRFYSTASVQDKGTLYNFCHLFPRT